MKHVTRQNFQKALKQLLQENLVGVYKDEGEGVFTFFLSGGQEFRIYIEEA